MASANVMFLYYKMGQAGIVFDCFSDRPIEYIFQGPKNKDYVLLLPECAAESGHLRHFAIFRLDYFDDFQFSEMEEGIDFL